MLSRDYILQVIKTFFEELDEAFNGKDEDDMEIQEHLNDLYTTYFKRDRESFLQSGTEEMIDFLKDDPDRMEKYDMLQELMYRDAEIQHDLEVRDNLYRKVVYLCEYITNHSMNFSLAYENRITEIKWLLAAEE